MGQVRLAADETLSDGYTRMGMLAAMNQEVSDAVEHQRESSPFEVLNILSGVSIALDVLSGVYSSWHRYIYRTSPPSSTYGVNSTDEGLQWSETLLQGGKGGKERTRRVRAWSEATILHLVNPGRTSWSRKPGTVNASFR